MKRRITFLVSPQETDTPEDALHLTKDSLKIKGLKAIREDRFTLTFEELPQFVKDVVKQTEELHLRFDNGRNYDAKWKGPFASRLPLGVHILALPLRESKMANLCSFISKYADIPCTSIETAFISRGRLKQLYVPDAALLPNILKPLANKICGPSKKVCKDKVSALSTATSLDLKYNATSQTLDVNAIWAAADGNAKGGLWDVQITTDTPDSKVEVGVLTDGGKPPEEGISLRGKLVTVGQDDELKPALVSFPSRHHARQSSIYMADFNRPTGLHPKLEVTLALGGSSPADGCSLNAYFTVPQPFFVDPYQLEDDKLMKSYGINKIKAVAGETDLEAPTWAMSKWGALVLAELDFEQYLSKWEKKRSPMEFTLPLHLRYMPTHPEKHSEPATLPWPMVFWACPSEHSSKMSTNPFDRIMLGYEEYFPEETYFHHLTPKLINSTLSRASLEVPILNSVDSQYIEWGTMGVIVIGFLWVFGRIVTSFIGSTNKVGEHEKKE
ncbi:protease B nonderepressible form [Orbilia blumenaviensis]|uniref:Protein PBN1 n=1 Tax=Orbilia blumenaviensis TaxID=1796055 RepID=A0AAV9VKS1_9PEZI